MPSKIRRNVNLWKKRPLSKDLIIYAVEDVSHLLCLADKLTAEVGKSQLQLLARLSQKYSQTFWLPADRTKSRGSVGTHEIARTLWLYLYLTQGTSGSWLEPLFWTNKGDDAADRAEVLPMNNEDEGSSDNTAADYGNDGEEPGSGEEEDYEVYSEEEDNDRSYYYSSSEDEVSSDDEYWDE